MHKTKDSPWEEIIACKIEWFVHPNGHGESLLIYGKKHIQKQNTNEAVIELGPRTVWIRGQDLCLTAYTTGTLCLSGRIESMEIGEVKTDATSD